MLYNKSFASQERENKRKKVVRAIWFMSLAVILFAVVLFLGRLSRKYNSGIEDSGGFNMFLCEHSGVSNNKALEQSTGSDVLNQTNAEVNNTYNISKQENKNQEFERQKVREACIELRNELKEYISGFKGEYGIFFIDLNTSIGFGIGGSDEYIAASTIKIPLNLYLYKKIADGTVNPQNTIEYLQEDYEEGTGRIQFEEFGKKYDLRELSMLSIVISDNVAANMLIRFLGRYNFKNYMREIGGTTVVYEENISCPRDMAIYMKRVYEFYGNNKILGKQLMDCLEKTIYNDRIPRLLPSEVRVAHKVGNWPPSSYSDIGIVFAVRPYVISIMSKDVASQEEAYKVIAHISRKAYDYVTKIAP